MNQPNQRNEEAPVYNVADDVCNIIIGDYLGEFTELYATAVGLVEMHPEQVNNEIRNALTHLARALSAANAQEAQSQVRKAKDHIERGKRDCLKISIIEIRDRLRGTIHMIEHTVGVVPQPIKLRLKEIERMRRTSFLAETRNEPMLDTLTSILADALDLEAQLEQQYGNMACAKNVIKRFFNKLKKHCATIIGALIIGVITGILLPNDGAIGKVREKISGTFSDIFLSDEMPVEKAKE